MWRYAGKNCTTFSGVVLTGLILFKAMQWALIVGDAFGEVAFMITLIGSMFLPAIIWILIVVIYDSMTKKKEKKIAKAEEEIKKQQELDKEVREFNGKITETLNSKKEKIIIKEK